VTGAAQRWQADLATWAIPEEIMASTGRSPWGHPVQRFAARADADLAAPTGMSYQRALEALTDVRRRTGRAGTVLDVGAGAGAACLPLAPWAAEIVAVDRSSDMLAAFATRAARLEPAVPTRAVEGSWPQVADEVGVHDLVVCHHVVYDVQDIAPFVSALTAAARNRVVLELTPGHPMRWSNPLWLRFHGIARPTRPTSGDLVAVLHDAGVRALTVDRWVREDAGGLTEQDRVALVTRRLCLPVEREAEVAAALAEHPEEPRHRVVTVSWAGSGNAGPARP
jgi:SAM-dependent methyltransferase